MEFVLDLTKEMLAGRTCAGVEGELCYLAALLPQDVQKKGGRRWKVYLHKL